MKLGSVVVTGGSGFIGSHLVKRLEAHAKSICVVDLNAPSAECDYRGVDIRDSSALLKELPKQIDTIFHLAARTSVLESVADPVGTFETNVVGTQNLLELARIRGSRRFILASTNAVVGNLSQDKLSETSPLRPMTPYGSTKAAGEVLSNAHATSYGFIASQLRLTNVYGTGMVKKDSVIPRLMKTALGLSHFSVFGDGEQYRDYVNVKDVANTFVKMALIEHEGPVVIGAGESISVNELIKLASSVTGIDIKFEKVEAKAGEMRGVRVDNSLARRLGASLDIPLREGLEQTWDEFQRL